MMADVNFLGVVSNLFKSSQKQFWLFNSSL